MSDNATHRMTVELDLIGAYRELTRSGRMTNVFTPASDDSEGRWKAGDRIEVALALDERGEPRVLVRDAQGHEVLGLDPVVTHLGGHFAKRLLLPRGFRPNAGRLLAPGPQRPPSPHLDDCAFRCCEPTHPWSLLARAPLALVRMLDFHWACYANFSPLEEHGHVLWVPVQLAQGRIQLPHLPQSITPAILTDFMGLATASADHMLFFNSPHAGASQHHLHFQAMALATAPAIALACRSEIAPGLGILDGYPIQALAFDLPGASKSLGRAVASLEARQSPYNLIALDRRAYLVPRNLGNEVVEPFCTGVFGSLEVSGTLIFADLPAFDAANMDAVAPALSAMGLSREEVTDLVRGA